MSGARQAIQGPATDQDQAAQAFVHLHCHSHYSLLDGAAKISDLVKQAKSLGMNALAITDHGNLFGAIEFYNTCKAEGINPILGYEAYVAPGHRSDKEKRGGEGNEHSYHLTLLAQNRQGFQNLVKMASYAYTEGFYYKPRIDRELLETYHEGLIVLSGCVSSEFSKAIRAHHMDEATRVAEWFASIFGERFFVEVQDNGLSIQRECAEGAIEIADRLGIPLVATCDSHYICSQDAFAHEVLLCINTGTKMSDPKRMQYGSDQFYLKPPSEMYLAFPDRVDAVARSQEIANSVHIDLDFSKRHFPVFVPPAGKTDKDYLRELCEIGLQRVYGDNIPAAAYERLDYELGVINHLGFASYFLIVWDFVNYSLENGIPCGARGSACGALVSYLLGFSSVDPIHYGLLFERFLDPNRKEAPDIDIDFCQDRREKIIQYVREKYGEKNVAQIITFGTLAARAVLRDVGRALEIPLPRVDQIAKMIPKKPLGLSLDDALELAADLRQEYETDPDVKKMFDIGRKLEGLARSTGTHAAGVVIADQDLTNYIPLQKNDNIITTQWEMSILEQVGMLKVDFLGLRNLTIMTEALDLIREVRGIEVDLKKIPMSDAKTYELLIRGETKGVFQLESEGIRSLLVRMKPDRFEDIIATNALYRPGPLEGGMVEEYIEVKHGRRQPSYVHPVMQEILEETYGVMVYQEQVMLILNRLGDIELANAYKCIKAISKKKQEIIAKFRTDFVNNSVKKGVEAAKAEKIFELIEAFAGYGFNKSHSTAYALVAYQTAFLKAHYPAEFMAALLSSEIDKTDLLVEHIDDCNRMNIEVKPPDVNEGGVDFTVVAGQVRFGLAAIKGVGEKVVEPIVQERLKNGPYKDLYDFCERLSTKGVKKGDMEALIKAGAMDSFGAHRAQLLAAMPAAYQSGIDMSKARQSGQMLLFGGDDAPMGNGKKAGSGLPEVPMWLPKEQLAYERELLGIYLSSHPLKEHEPLLRIYRSQTVEKLAHLSDRTDVVLGGMISGVRKIPQSKGRFAGQNLARFTFEDLTGSVGGVMFASVYAIYVDKVQNDAICFVRANVDKSRDEMGIIVEEIISLTEAPKVLSGSLVVRLQTALHPEETILRLRNLFRSYPGQSTVYLEITDPEGLRVRLELAKEFQVACDGELTEALERMLGNGAVTISASTKQPSSSTGGGDSGQSAYRARPNANGQAGSNGKPRPASRAS